MNKQRMHPSRGENSLSNHLFSFIGNSTLCSFTHQERPLRDRIWNPYRITPIHWLMARRHLWRNDVVRSYWRTHHPLLRFLCLHEAVTLPFVVAISDPTYLFAIIHLHFGDCLSGTLFSSRWSAMEFHGEFTQDYLFPSPRARYTVSFGIDDVLLTAASDSEDFGPSLAEALPLSGQEARPSPAYSELMDVLSRAAEKLSHGLDDEPRDSRSSKLDERFLSVVNSKMSGGSCRFSVICIRRFPDPGNSLFLPALLTRRPLTSPTSWFRWSRAIPPCRVRDSWLAMTRTDK